MSEEKLSKKHQEFINQYFLCNMNQVDAYLKVYPKSSYDAARANSSRLIANDNIQAEIERRLKEKAMQANEVIARLSDMGRSSIANFADVRTAEDLAESEYAHLVKKLERTVTTDPLGRQREKIKIELYDAQAAIVQLGKTHGIFRDVQEHTGKDGGPITFKEIIVELPDE